LQVGAAFDLAPAFKEIGAAFEQKRGTHVEFAFGKTSELAWQVTNEGAFDVFASAMMFALDHLIEDGLCLKETKTLYARARIVMWSKDPKKVPKDVAELKDAKYSKIAMGHDDIPYGHAARQALTKIGIWAAVEPRVVYASGHEDILRFAASDDVDVTILALPHAVSSPANFVPIDAGLHDPLDQALVVCKRPNKGAKDANLTEARAFVEFVSSDAGRAIMRKSGFLLPGEPFSPR
jgi:molybdate transport system substrate-binding protein